MGKITVGPYTHHNKKSTAKGLYSKRSSGKLVKNGGFSGETVVDFTKISDARWAEIFGTSSLPKWKRDLIEAGESIE